MLFLTSETKTDLQSCLDNLQAYCQKWKLMINNKKTKVMVVEKKQLNIEELCKSARRVMCILLGSTNKFASGNLRVLLKPFDRMILPICTYNSEV